MTSSPVSPSETFAALRDQLFGRDLSQMAPPVDDRRGDGPEVYGAAMEGGLEGGSYLVFGLRDGSASLYLSTGGGSIGGQGRPHINAAARAFVATATAFAEQLPRSTSFPLPSVGRGKFAMRSSTCCRIIASTRRASRFVTPEGMRRSIRCPRPGRSTALRVRCPRPFEASVHPARQQRRRGYSRAAGGDAG